MNEQHVLTLLTAMKSRVDVKFQIQIQIQEAASVCCLLIVLCVCSILSYFASILFYILLAVVWVNIFFKLFIKRST